MRVRRVGVHAQRPARHAARALAPIWRTTAEGIDASLLAARPAEGVWSALEYAAHSRDVTAMMSYAVTRALEEENPDFGPPPDAGDPVVPDSLAVAIAQLDKQVAKLNGTANRMGADGWARPFTVGDEVLDVRWAIAHAVHDATHHLRDVGRGLHALGAGAPSQQGTRRAGQRVGRRRAQATAAARRGEPARRGR